MGKNQGNQTGPQKGKQQNFPKCPVCGTRPLPKDREVCLVCRPEYAITDDLTRGVSGWEMLVQTYKNGVQANVSFVVDVLSKKVAIVEATSNKYWKSSGVAVIPLEFSDKKRTASFHIIGGPADIRQREIPAEKPAGFKSVKPDTGQGFWKNLLKGLEGLGG
ncbi:hypothetical protein GW933_04540 [Candidatus Falkowbacteria bacterium]|uniref:Uncharacterized protein n=1 Tax=Candidatus Buchananbacteria bacterium CG10_big_fil_rev_8_21_14_0_10_33_19 TaxID=1974525 RepID=A0A2H0W733_9BACT|nr:hypothetical protein [Candidatus Falkowbacteria bacterium]PIS06401.1 MAG: hypothetical protein COT80_00455 [Candidatus Buchananbacteria bacterium CG10_big_fil_rev_8_21_14_0_10_33_19]